MKNRDRKDTPAIGEAIAASASFEVTIADLARRSERRAWFVAFGAILMALILASGYFLMLPLKQKVPYLVMADAYTGTSTVARLRDDFANRSVTTSTAINRSNVAHFVLARESYDAALINLRDWTTVYTMAAPSVAAGYRALYASTNPDNPFTIYGDGKAIRVRILSIVLLGGGDGGTPPKGATVRFQRTLYDKSSGSSVLMDGKIATLEFTYENNLDMDEKYRIENPLGFRVTSYRVDNDYAESPPPERVVRHAAGAAAPVLAPQVPMAGNPDAANLAYPVAPTAPGATAPASADQAAPAPDDLDGASTR